MKKYDKVLFVSHSDTSRGPMAEAILQNKMLLEDILVDSKGMIVLFPEPVNPKAKEILSQHKLELPDHEAVAFSADDFDERTLITARRRRGISTILMARHWKSMVIVLMYWN